MEGETGHCLPLAGSSNVQEPGAPSWPPLREQVPETSGHQQLRPMGDHQEVKEPGALAIMPTPRLFSEGHRMSACQPEDPVCIGGSEVLINSQSASLRQRMRGPGPVRLPPTFSRADVASG